MKIEIARSFSKKIQIKQYEPIEFFCSAKTEVEITSHFTEVSESSTAQKVSEQLDKLVQSEVEKSANKLKVVDTKKIKDTAQDEAEHDVGSLVEES